MSKIVVIFVALLIAISTHQAIASKLDDGVREINLKKAPNSYYANQIPSKG